jgi:hypothetical protein
MKKGQSMSLNVIVVAALVILVLIVLSVIFIRSGGSFTNNVGSCEVQGGKCAAVCGDAGYGTEDYTVQRGDLQCPTEGEKCCLQIS